MYLEFAGWGVRGKESQFLMLRHCLLIFTRECLFRSGDMARL